MKNTMIYHGFRIEENSYGSYNASGVNCFSTPTIENAQRAIDAYRERNGLDEEGIPVRA